MISVETAMIIAGAVIVAIVLTLIITRLALLRSYESKSVSVQALTELNQLKNEFAALQSRESMFKTQYEEARLAANTRNDENQQLGNQLAASIQLAENFNEQLSQTVQQVREYKGKWEQASLQLIEKSNTLARTKAESEAQAQRFAEQAKYLEGLELRMTASFELLAGQTLEAKTTSFRETQASEFTHLLAPLKQELTDLKEKLNASHNNASAERNTLFGQVKEMIGQTKQLSEQAENLTQALKGQAKQQGDWGEWILESILEYSGLTKDREYVLQHNEKNAAGKNIRPDVVVKYPDNRFMIIDSKVSLVGYDRIIASKDPAEQQLLTAQLVKHIKNHIDGLSSKDYQQKKDALDFVVMFVPLEGAYISAMQFEPDLWKYAYDRRIFLLSPTNLVAALRLVHNMWQRDAINKNAEVIAARAALMYDKLAGFIEVFDKAGKCLDQATVAFSDARKKLTTGKGNLVSQAKQMNDLQKRLVSDKQLPDKLVEEAMFEEQE